MEKNVVIKCLEEIMSKYGSIEELELVKYKLIYLPLLAPIYNN